MPINLQFFNKLPELLSAKDLVRLGLYPTTQAVFFARVRGRTPAFVRIGKKVLYLKQSLISLLSKNSCGTDTAAVSSLSSKAGD